MTDTSYVNYQCTADVLWDHLYLVKFPKMATTSVDYLRAVGMHITGDRRIDETMAGEWITTYISIARMIEYYEKGVQIRIIKEDDVEDIYYKISAHLDAWINHLRYAINIGDAPIEDLIEMDRFANDIYSHAKYRMTGEVMNSFLRGKFAETLTFTPSNFMKLPSNAKINSPLVLKNPISGVTTIHPLENEIPERVPLGNYLKEQLTGLKRWGRENEEYS